MVRLLSLFVLTMCLGTSLFAAKAPNITTSGTITLPGGLSAPEIQDLSTTDIIFNKTMFENFTSIYTTMTLRLYQDYRGKIVGSAVFRTEEENAGATDTELLNLSSLTGKVKNGKVGKKFKPNTFTVNASTSISMVIYTLSVKGEMVPDSLVPGATDDELDTVLYNMAVKVTGLKRTYNYTLPNVPVRGHFRFTYRYPTEGEMPRKLNPDKYEYFMVMAPWGEGLVQGTFQMLSDTAALFTLKGSKFLYSTTDYGFDGFEFEPDAYTLKTGMGKSAGTPMVAP